MTKYPTPIRNDKGEITHYLVWVDPQVWADFCVANPVLAKKLQQEVEAVLKTFPPSND